MKTGSQERTILDKIVEARRESVAHRKRVLPDVALKMAVEKSEAARDFAGALSRDGFNVIAELKKASPSKGMLREQYAPAELAAALAGAGAAALSVLTEEEFFQGSLADLKAAKKACGIPVLRKDFIIDPWQVWEARAAGAGARIIGVNNRDLRDFSVKLETSLELIEEIPEECIAVSESGLRTHEDLARLRRAGFDAFLIGEHLMRYAEPGEPLRELIGRGAGRV